MRGGEPGGALPSKKRRTATRDGYPGEARSSTYKGEHRSPTRDVLPGGEATAITGGYPGSHVFG